MFGNKYHLLLCFLMLCAFLNGQTLIPAGNVSGNWLLSNSPYKIQGNITVPNGFTLNIEPGVVVEFQGKYRLFCNGQILAIGTSALPIIFTVPNSNIGTGWLGIRFDDTPVTNAASYFKYCTVMYGRADSLLENTGGGFYFNNFSDCTIENCLIANNFAQDGGSAISGIFSSPLIKNCTFSGNSIYQGANGIQLLFSSSIIEGNTFVGEGIHVTDSDLIIRNNHITGNTQSGISVYTINPLNFTGTTEITNNIIENNTSTGGAGGGGIILANGNAKIEHNVIQNNLTDYGGGGITCYNEFDNSGIEGTVISNNLIYGNSSGMSLSGVSFGGGGIFCSGYSPKIINNTIYDNVSHFKGGGIKCVSNSDPQLYNNIIYSNTAGNVIQNIFLFENNCDPIFFNNCLQGGLDGIDANEFQYTGSFLNNFDAPPLFNNVAINDYSLMAVSPCVNSGSSNIINSFIPLIDLIGNPRISGASVDVGAYEFQESLNVDANDLQNSIFCYPNPASEMVLLSNDVDEVSIFDMRGSAIQMPFNKGRQINISQLQSGLYLLMIKKENHTVQIKFIKK